MQSERTKDIIFCLLAFGAALAILAGSLTYQTASAYFPQMLALFVATLAAVLGVQRLKSPEPGPADDADDQSDLNQLVGFAKVLVSVLLYTGAMLVVGFSVATFLFLVLMMLLLGERKLAVLAGVAIGLTGLLVLLFFWFLGVYPPEALFAF